LEDADNQGRLRQKNWEAPVSNLDDCRAKLVVANRILAHENVMDAYGHVSMRHPDQPDRFLMSCSRSPELVTLDDLMEFDLDCNPIAPDDRRLYGERPIHGAIYKARPDVQAVVHNHSHDVLPYTVSRNLALRPMIHSAACIGHELPVWDIRSRFGDTNLLVLTMDHGRDLAQRLGANAVVLMRGHGCTVVADTIEQVVMRTIYLTVNAKLQLATLPYGDITFLSEREIELSSELHFSTVSMARAWEYWARRSGSA
jgi:HCOMODA/2-hydroxy-3-carboxy-muconic semialdehyde decarboxylase